MPGTATDLYTIWTFIRDELWAFIRWALSHANAETLSALGSFGAAWFAYKAAKAAAAAVDSWRKTLQQQTADACKRTALESRSSIYRLVEFIKNKPNYGNVEPTRTEAWDNWRRFEQDYEVAKENYPDRLTGEEPEQINRLLQEIGLIDKANPDEPPTVTQCDRLDGIAEEADRLARGVVDKLYASGSSRQR